MKETLEMTGLLQFATLLKPRELKMGETTRDAVKTQPRKETNIPGGEKIVLVSEKQTRTR